MLVVAACRVSDAFAVRNSTDSPDQSSTRGCRAWTMSRCPIFLIAHRTKPGHFRTVVDARAGTDGGWPIWQNILLKLDAQGLDAYEVVQGLPTWGHSYRLAWIDSSGAGAPPRWSRRCI